MIKFELFCNYKIFAILLVVYSSIHCVALNFTIIIYIVNIANA